MNTTEGASLPLSTRLRVLMTLVRAELAAGIFGLKLFIACVAVATVMMGGVWMMGDGLTRALSHGGTTLLGGDVAVTTVNVPLNDDISDGLAALGTVSRVAELRSSALLNGMRSAVELKGVDALYPLFGKVRLVGGGDIQAALAPKDGMPSAVVESALLRRANAEIGDTIRLGGTDFRIADELLLEPDRLSAGRFMVGPRIFLRFQDLQEAGLIQRGSIVDFRYRIDAPADMETAPLVEAIRALAPDFGWELETPQDAGDRVRRTIERTTTFLGMAGIVALAIGLAGAWAAAKAWVSRRARTIALYRLSGATPGMVLALHGVIVAAASICGLVIGTGVAWLTTVPVMDIVTTRLHLVWGARDLLPPMLEVVWIMALGIAGTGVWALAGAARLSPGAAMRSGEADLRPDNKQLGWGAALMAASMIGATLSLPVPGLAGIAVGGLFVAALVLGLSGWTLAKMTAIGAPKGFIGMVTRQGLSNTGAAATRAVAIGVGIAGITAIVAAQHSLEQALRSELPKRIPDLVLIDVQPDQVSDVRRMIVEDPGLDGLTANPFMRAQVTAVNGVPAAEALVRPDKSWTIEGDRNFSWSAEPTGAELLSGEWWPEDYSGPPLVSPEEDLYEALDLKPGDMLTYTVSGRSFTSKVANVRKEYHRTFRPRFLLMASPEPFRNAPQSWIMSLQGDSNATVDTFINSLGERYPNVTAIDIRQIVKQVSEVVEGAVFGSLIVALTLLVAGGLSLAAVIAAEVDARRREALAFSLVGASRIEIAVARLAEASSIGAIAAVLGGAAGLLGGFWVVDAALRVAWAPGALAYALPVLLGLVAAVSAGVVGGLGAVPRGRGQMVRHLTA